VLSVRPAPATVPGGSYSQSTRLSGSESIGSIFGLLALAYSSVVIDRHPETRLRLVVHPDVVLSAVLCYRSY